VSDASPTAGFRSGFVAVVGRPNTGKSALVNRLIGAKVAITSPIPLTTRTRVHGVLSLPHAQLVVADTPGIHQPRDQLGTRMVAATRQAVTDADVNVWVLDAVRGVTDEDRRVVPVLQLAASPVVVAITKVDRVAAAHVDAIARSLPTLLTSRASVPVSAVTGTNVDQLVQLLVTLLPPGPQYFPPAMHTDQPEPFFIAELIREQAFAVTREEVPHGLAVEIDEITPRPGQDLLYIRAGLLVERASHKKIVVGRGGQVLKRVGERARREIEQARGGRVFLDLWVRVSPGWRDRLDLLRVLYPG